MINAVLWQHVSFCSVRSVCTAHRTHILLKRSGAQRRKCQFLSSKWFSICEEGSWTRAMMCCNVTELSGLRKSVYKIRCKWGDRIGSLVLGVEERLSFLF